MFPSRFFKIGQIFRQTEDGHDFRGSGDVEARLSGQTSERTPNADDDFSKNPVIHVHDSLPGDGSAVEQAARTIKMEAVIHHGRQEVVGGGHGMDIASEMEVDFITGHHLGSPSSGGSAFHPEDRTQGGLPQSGRGLLAQSVQGIHQTDGRRGLALSGRSRRHGCHHDQLSTLTSFSLNSMGIYFCLVGTVFFQTFGINSQFCCDLFNGSQCHFLLFLLSHHTYLLRPNVIS